MGFHEKAKPFRDYAPVDEIREIKRAIRACIAKIGKPESVVSHFKEQDRTFNGGRISEWKDLDRPTSMPTLWQVAQIEAMAGVDWITQAMAAMHDADVVKRVRSPDPTAVLISRLAVAAREFGEACAASAEYVANPDCRKRHEAAVREFQEAMRALMGMGAALENTGEAA